MHANAPLTPARSHSTTTISSRSGPRAHHRWKQRRDPARRIAVLLAVVGGFGVGYFSVTANDCPFRQHVLVAQGTVSSMVYLAGFFSGGVVFHLWVGPPALDYLP